MIVVIGIFKNLVFGVGNKWYGKGVEEEKGMGVGEKRRRGLGGWDDRGGRDGGGE